MRLRRVRFTIRRMMAAVALAAVVLLAGIVQYRNYRSAKFRRSYPNPVMPSRFFASAARHDRYIAGRPIPIAIDWDFTFGPPKPPDGTPFRLRGRAWLEEENTGIVADSYTIERALTPGAAERLSGPTTWNAKVARPGNYVVCYLLESMTPVDPWRTNKGGRSMILRVDAAAPE